MLQIMIEAESVEDMRKQLLELVSQWGVRLGVPSLPDTNAPQAEDRSADERARPEDEDPAVLTVYETEPGGIRVLWDRATGGVKVSPDGEWLMPSTWNGSVPDVPPKNDNPPAPTQKTVKMAEEMGIDIADVRGTGKNGRVTQADLKEYAKNRAPCTQEEPAPEPAPEPAAEPATTPSGGDPFAENEDSTPDAGTDDIEPTKENAKNALRVVHGEKGMDACMKVLQASGARKIGELKEDQYATFIQNCAEDIQVDTAGLKEKIGALEG